MQHIPDYSPDEEQNFSAMVAEARGKIFAVFKIFDSYPDETELKKNQLVRKAIAEFVHERWDLSRYSNLNGVPPTPDQANTLKMTGEEFMQNLAESFAMTTKVESLFSGARSTTSPENIRTDYIDKDIVDTAIFQQHENAIDLLDIYTNQLTRQALFKIKSFGFTEEESFKICRTLVHKAVEAYRTCNNHQACRVRPKIMPDDPIDASLARVMGFSQKLTQALQLQ